MDIITVIMAIGIVITLKIIKMAQNVAVMDRGEATVNTCSGRTNNLTTFPISGGTIEVIFIVIYI